MKNELELFQTIKNEKQPMKQLKLFNQKVRELQELFKNESLDKLKDINLSAHYGQETAASLGMVVERDDEGPIGDIEPQESDDSELEESGQK